MTSIIVRIVIFTIFALFSAQVFAQGTTNLLIKGEVDTIRISVKDGEIVMVTVNDKIVPNERVRLEGAGLKVTDEQGRTIGAMANLSASGPSPIRRKPANAPIPVYSDNPDLKIEIKDSRFLLVTRGGRTIPENRIVIDDGAIKILDENGDVLRVIRADSPKMANSSAEVPASEITEKIAAGQQVNYENVTVTGDLDLTRLPNQINDSVYPENGKGVKVFTGNIAERVVFKNVTFAGKINLFRKDEGEKEVAEYRAAFKKDAIFENCTFEKTANFELTNFDGAVSMRGSRFLEKPLFIRVGLSQAPDLEGTNFEKGSVFQFTQNSPAANLSAEQLRELIAKVY